MQKAPYVFPIIGGRKVEHFQANLEALEISLLSEQIAYLDGLTNFNKGFPYSVFVRIFLSLKLRCGKGSDAVACRAMDPNMFGSSRLRDTLIGGLMHRLFALASRVLYGNWRRAECMICVLVGIACECEI